MRVFAGFPIWGDAIERHGLDTMVGVARDSGIEGLWVGDHVALARHDGSRYPGKSSGSFFLDPTAAWYEALTTLGYVAAHAGHMDLGIAVALPVLRPPVLFAKQVATLSRLCRGDVTLGVGAGWQRAEYEAVGVPWEERGARLNACIEVICECWTGEPAPGDYGHYRIPPGLMMHPTPVAPIPVLVGGTAPAAFRRASRLGDGWIGALQDWDGGLEEAARQLGGYNAARRVDPEPRMTTPSIGLVAPVPGDVARRPGFARELAERLEALAGLGFDTVALGFSWRRLDQARSLLEMAVEASGRLASAPRHDDSQEARHG